MSSVRLSLAVFLVLGAVGELRAETYVWTPEETEVASEQLVASARSEAPSDFLQSTMFALAPESTYGATAVTVFFDEGAGGFLSVILHKDGAGELLSEDLFEGTGMLNQKTLIIPAAPGRVVELEFMEPGEETCLKRVQFKALEERTVAVDPDIEDLAALLQSGPATLDLVSGFTGGARADAVHGDVVDAQLVAEAVRIEEGVAFEFAVGEVPSTARLELLVAGLPADRSCTVWVNGVEAGDLQVDIPSLTRSGYRIAPPPGEGELPGYIGWRKATALVAGNLLRAGDNQIVFQVAASPLGIEEPVAVKDVGLELWFPVEEESALQIDNSTQDLIHEF